MSVLHDCRYQHYENFAGNRLFLNILMCFQKLSFMICRECWKFWILTSLEWRWGRRLDVVLVVDCRLCTELGQDYSECLSLMGEHWNMVWCIVMSDCWSELCSLVLYLEFSNLIDQIYTLPTLNIIILSPHTLGSIFLHNFFLFKALAWW